MHIMYLMEKSSRQQFPNWLVDLQPGSLHCILDPVVQEIYLKNESGDAASLPQILPVTLAQWVEAKFLIVASSHHAQSGPASPTLSLVAPPSSHTGHIKGRQAFTCTVLFVSSFFPSPHPSSCAQSSSLTLDTCSPRQPFHVS